MFNNADNNLKALTTGAFLVTGKEDANVMTIGWGFVGYMWKKKVFVAPIRTSRYSHELIEKNGTFTVSFPASDKMRDELKYTGTKSGRDTDKFSALGLEKVEAPLANSYFVGGCDTYYECKVLGKIDLDNDMLDDSVKAFYKDGDMHTLYFGEILD